MSSSAGAAPDERANVVTHGHPPGPRFLTPFHFLREMKRDSLGFFARCARQYGDFVCVRFPPLKSYLAYHPDDVQRVLRDNHRNYWKGPLIGKFKRIAGEGLVFSDGDLWKRQRQIVQPAFRRSRIDAMSGMIATSTERALDGFEKRAAEGGAFDMLSDLSGLTLEIVARALFGTDFRDDREAFGDAVTRGLQYADHLMGSFFPPPMWFPTRANRAGASARRDLDRYVWKIIDERRRGGLPEGEPDLLSFLLGACAAEDATTMDDRQLRDEMVTFLVAGHETTAVALSWTAYLLARHPDATRRLESEVDRVLSGRTPAPADLADLPYVRMVFEESMRMYPPVWGTTRTSFDEDQLGGYTVPAGAAVSVSPYVTHRNPELWDDPECFDPERFAPEQVAGRHPFAYFPFGGGPRACIGRHFAMLEGQMILAMLVQRFRLSRADDQEVRPDPILTLRPAGPIRVHLSPRSPRSGSVL